MKNLLFAILLFSVSALFAQPVSKIAEARAYVNANIVTNTTKAISAVKVNTAFAKTLNAIQALRDTSFISTLQASFDASGSNPGIEAAGKDFIINNTGFGAFYSGTGSHYAGFEAQYPSAGIVSGNGRSSSSSSVGDSLFSVFTNIYPESKVTTLKVRPGYVTMNHKNAEDSFGLIKVGIGLGEYTQPQVPLHVYGDGSYSAAFVNGYVGIGTTTPGSNLTVASSYGTIFNALNSIYNQDRLYVSTDGQFVVNGDALNDGTVTGNTVDIGNAGFTIFKSVNGDYNAYVPRLQIGAGDNISDIQIRNSNLVISNEGGYFKLPQYTVSTLPSDPGPVTGAMAFVTDADSPAWNTPVVGGGSEVVTVFYNGTNWVCK